MKEEVDYDPTKTEFLNVTLKINGKTIISDDDNIPWIINEVEDKIQTALGMDQPTALFIGSLSCESWVANEFLDMLCCCDLPE